MERDSLTDSIQAKGDRRACLASLISLACAALLSSTAAAQPGQSAIYSCNVNGKTFSGDRVPPECSNADVRELNRDGSVRRVIARPLTLEEQRARAMEAKKRLEDEDQQLAQRRRDKSLLEAYASEEEIEAARVKSLQSSNQVVVRATQRIAGLSVERKKLDDESEFYKKRVLPDHIKRSYVSNQQQLSTEEKIVSDAQMEIQRINERFDAEKKRFREVLALGARPVQRNPDTDILLDPRFRGK